MLDVTSIPGIEALRQALMRSPVCAGLPLDALRPLPTTGLAHDHVRLGDTGWLLRAPKQSQMGFSAPGKPGCKGGMKGKLLDSKIAPK